MYICIEIEREKERERERLCRLQNDRCWQTSTSRSSLANHSVPHTHFEGENGNVRLRHAFGELPDVCLCC